tara:strand:+ start:1423 stop:2166 length:744 start_codon:yes stop_codon:yes gene_type:complete
MLPTRREVKASVNKNNPGFDRRVIAETGIIPAGYQLIQDSFSFDVIDKQNVVVEDRNGKELPAMRVSGLIQMGDRENANGRIYSTNDVLRPAVESIQEDISSRAVMGEFDHPADAKIHLDRVSHLMTKVWMDGRKVYGEAEILHNLPCGACLRGLFEHKVRVGISSRGVGDMDVVEGAGKELYQVMPGYAFVTWDAVAEPSVNGAILNIQEGLNKRLRPMKKGQNRYSPEVYSDMLVSEINKFFGLK